jgi:2TM domain
MWCRVDFVDYRLLHTRSSRVEQQRRSALAAQQVEKRIGFYVHLSVFVLVCAGLAAVNIFATPEVWWAQWPFIGWGVAVIFHGLCAYGRGLNAVAAWRLRKIHQLSRAEPPPPDRSRTKPAALFAMLLLGGVLGALVGGGYMCLSVRDAREETRKAQQAANASEKTVKQLDAELQDVSKQRADFEKALKETQQQLGQVEASKGATEKRLREVTDQLLQAHAAREEAERALAEAKKRSAQ